MITLGVNADIIYITVAGTVHCRHLLRPLPRLCRATSSVIYRGVILILHSLLTLYSHPRVLNMTVLKVRSHATHWSPRVVLRRDNREGTTGVQVCLDPDRWLRELPNHESRAPPGGHVG